MDIINLTRNYKYIYTYFTPQIFIDLSRTCKFLYNYCKDYNKKWKNTCETIFSMLKKVFIYSDTSRVQRYIFKKIYALNSFELIPINYIPNNYIEQYSYITNKIIHHMENTKIEDFIFCFKLISYNSYPENAQEIIFSNLSLTNFLVNININHNSVIYHLDALPNHLDFSFIINNTTDLNNYIVSKIKNNRYKKNI